MTAERAVAAARERLAEVEASESSLVGALREAQKAAVLVPDEIRRSVREMVRRGDFQSRWNDIRARAEAAHDDGDAALMAALLELSDDLAELAHEVLAKRVAHSARARSHVALERSHLAWVVSLADERDPDPSTTPTVPPPARSEE